MYNEAQKIKFIKDTAKSIKSAESMEYMFNRCEKYEILWNKDVCCASDVEIQQLINNIAGFRTSSTSLYLKYLRRYISWCTNHGVEGTRNKIRNIDTDDLSRFRRAYVANPTHLQYYLDLIFDPEDDMTVDNVYRSYFWVAFSGILEKDLTTINRSDIDFYTMSILHNGDRFPIYRDGIKALRNASTLDGFLYKHPNYSNDVLRKRVDDYTLLSGIRGVPSVETFRSQVRAKILKSAKGDEISVAISYDRVRLSGIFYRVYQCEQAFMQTDLSDEINRRVRENILSGGNMKESVYRYQVNARLNSDYDKWKRAFVV